MLNLDHSKSPLRIFKRSEEGGVRAGDLGVVMARAGVGKTAFLVQVGIDHALRERKTLHIALGEDLDHVHSWYDALFEDIAEGSADYEAARERLNKNHLIQAYATTDVDPEKLAELLKLYDQSMDFIPAAILIDGYNWNRPTAELQGEIELLKQLAATMDAQLWMSATTQRAVTTDHPTRITPPCDAVDEKIDVAVFLEPEGTNVVIRLLKEHDNPTPLDTHLVLHTDTMQIATDDAPDRRVNLPASAFTLLSGSAKGSEFAFGEAAEKYGVGEVNFTFAGREPKRSRGLEVLSSTDLERGAVSPSYIAAQLHRSFPKTETFQRILKMIWHQIATAGEVFAIGNIQEDGTVRGGTGWGVELGKHFGKRVYVFDQTSVGWFQWKDDAWQSVDAPVIRRTRFSGTGTRFPTEAGVKAVQDLFERSFGAEAGTLKARQRELETASV